MAIDEGVDRTGVTVSREHLGASPSPSRWLRRSQPPRNVRIRACHRDGNRGALVKRLIAPIAVSFCKWWGVNLG